MKKRMILCAMLLALGMSSVLTGCGSKNNEGGSAGESESESVSESKSEGHGCAYEYNKVIMEGLTDIFDQITVLYTAYLCGLENPDAAIPHKEFIGLIPPNQIYLSQLVRELLNPKKPTDSEQPSGVPENQNKE